MTNQLRTGGSVIYQTPAGPEAGPEYLTYDEVERRIASLKDIRVALTHAVVAIKALEVDGEIRKREYDELRDTIRTLEEDKKAAELLLGVPEGSFTRILDRATKKGRWRGRVDGFVVGVLSSLLAWYASQVLPQLSVPGFAVKPQSAQSAKP